MFRAVYLICMPRIRCFLTLHGRDVHGHQHCKCLRLQEEALPVHVYWPRLGQVLQDLGPAHGIAICRVITRSEVSCIMQVGTVQDRWQGCMCSMYVDSCVMRTLLAVMQLSGLQSPCQQHAWRHHTFEMRRFLPS